MFGLKLGEIVMLAVVVLIIFSASRMGALGNALGKFVHSFKKASKGDGFIDATPTLKRGTEDGQVIDVKKQDSSP
jgi:sec-independent protein translocase protein TatA